VEDLKKKDFSKLKFKSPTYQKKIIKKDESLPPIKEEENIKKVSLTKEEKIEYDKTKQEEYIREVSERINKLKQNYLPRINLDNYTKKYEHFNFMKNYISSIPLLIPPMYIVLSAKKFIEDITLFKYNPFDSPDFSMCHSIEEIAVILMSVSELFHFQFLDLAKEIQSYHFRDLDTKIYEFLKTKNDIPTTKVEYYIIRSFINKLILSLHTSEDFAFKDNSKILINTDFKKVIAEDVKNLSHIQKEKGKTFTSWTTFKDILLDFKQDGKIYKHISNQRLNEMIKKSLNINFSFEGIFASALKCYTPAIALDYFYALKAVIILGRLISVYVNAVEKPKIIDLYHIAVVSISTYENKYHIISQTARAIPKYEKGLSEETQAYYVNHLISGPQFMLLKMLEKCIPILAVENN
jgi:hypothetical protein